MNVITMVITTTASVMARGSMNGWAFRVQLRAWDVRDVQYQGLGAAAYGLTAALSSQGNPGLE